MREPLAWISLGTILACFAWPAVPQWAAWAAMLGFAGLACRFPRPITLAMAGVGIGLVSGHLQPPQPPMHSRVVGKVQTVASRSAMVATDAGRMWLRFQHQTPPTGSLISARIRTAFESAQLPDSWPTSMRAHLARARPARAEQWVGSLPPRTVDSAVLNRKHGGIIFALVTGDRNFIPTNKTELLRNTGTIHLLAISGLHVGVLASLGGALAWALSRPFVLLGWVYTARLFPAAGAVLAAVFYGDQVGWPVSTQRALWMVTGAGLATFMGRSVSPWQLMGGAALAVVLVDPSVVASIGFLLSFGAVAGIIGWGQWLTSWVNPSQPWWARWTANSLAASVGATVGTLPIAAWVFQHLALASPLANLMAIPLFAIIAVPASLLAVQLDQPWLLPIADLAIDTALTALHWFQWGTVNPAVGLTGACLLGVVVVLHKRPLVAAVIAAFAFAVPPVGPGLQVTFPDVGQGSAALVRFDDGRTWLIDGGPPGQRLLFWLRREGIRRLDAVILSHPDIDHYGGLGAVVNELEVGALWVSRRPKTDELAFHNLWRDAHLRGIPSHIVGQPVGYNDNEEGVVVRVRHGNHAFLFTGDIGKATEKRLAPHARNMTVVTVPHHGSDRSSSVELIVQADPLWCVVQSGKNNRFGHPRQTVIDAWGLKRMLQTSNYGSVRFHSDGLKLKTEHWNRLLGWSPVR